MRRALPVLLAALTLLAGCGDSPRSTSSAEPTATSSAGATPTSSVSPSSPSPAPPSLPRSRVQSANLHLAVLASSAARTAEERAVVAAWMQFWQGWADTEFFQRPTPAFDRVAGEQVRASTLEHVASVKAERKRVVGWARDNVTSVRVRGSRATVRDCVENNTFTVDHEAEPTSRPAPFLDVRGRLEKVANRWRVVAQDTEELTRDCRA
jgi:hypothetical protein